MKTKSASRRVRILGSGALACMALLAASCGKPREEAAASASGAGAATDVCALVGKDSVSAIIGQPIVAAKAADDGCRYETEDAMASSVEIHVKRNGAVEEMATARKASGVLADVGAGMEGAKGATADVGKTLQDSANLSGMGEEAFFDSNQTLHVLDKGVYFTVAPPVMKSRMGTGNPMLSGDERREMAKAIAEKVAAAL